MPRLDYETHEMWTARTIRELRHFADSLERGDMVLAHEDGHGYIDARHKDDEGDLSVLVTHARSGDAAMIASYMGSSRTFDEAICDFAGDYADQAECDHQAFVKAIRDGRVKAVVES